MLAYFLGITMILPVVMAIAFLIKANSLLRRAAVFFMAVALTAGALWAAFHGAAVYEISSGQTKIMGTIFMIGNFAVLFVTTWLGWCWKNRLIVVLTAIQAAMLGWIYFQPGSDTAGIFVLDHLSLLLILLLDGVGPLIILAALHQMENEGRRRFQSRFFIAAAFLLAAMNGLLLAGNLLWMLFFWQLGMLGAFFLLVHDRSFNVWKNMRNIIIINSIGGIAFIAGIFLCLDLAKTLILRELLVFRDATSLLLPLSFLILAGFAGAAQFPFQSRLIRASTANVSVTVLLQATTVINAGVYLILRLAPLFMNTWLAKILAIMGAFSFAAAALMALRQFENKRALSYSTISTMGLSITLACIADLQAIYAAVLIVFLHGMSKGLIFLSIGNRSDRLIPKLLLVFGALSMLMPPFGIPASLWTAIEVSARQPAVLVCLVAGSIFYFLFWARLIGIRVSNLALWQDCGRWELLPYAVHLVLGVGVLLFSVFLVPVANYFVAPILKENYSRFGDIAQAEAGSLLFSGFLSVNPLYIFLIIIGGCILGWIICRSFAGKRKEAAAVEIKEEITVEAEETPAQEMHSNYLPWLPERRKIELYANMIAVALIVLMFEVIVR